MADNMLRQIKLILYRLKRQFGVKVDVYCPLSQDHNVSTGVVTKTYDIYRIRRVPVFVGKMMREFIYDLAFIAANKNFTLGMFFETDMRLFLIDRKDLPKGVTINNRCHLIYRHRRYEISLIEPTEGDRGYLIIGKDIETAPQEEQHLIKVFQTLSITQEIS